MKSFKLSLAWQILIAMVLGILLGSYLHYHSDSREWLIANLLSPAGDIFIHLIKMIVVPIVISTLIVGIAGVGDAKQLGRIGAKTILYFEVITTIAIILGITLANVFQPGSGIDMSQLATVDISKYQNTTAEVQSHAHGLMGTILSLVPTNIVASMAKGDMLPIIFFSVLFGLGLSSLPATHRYLHYHSDSREWLIANLLSPAGDIFIHLIKMIVVPIVISTLIVGIAGVGDAKQLGRIGAKTILYFEVITTIAIILGITLANVFQPGSGIDMSQLATVDISKYQNTTAEVQSHAHGLMGTILSLVPTNIVASMAKGDMLPIIFFSVLFGLGLSSLPATHREPLVTVFRSISETMFKVTHMVMRYAPVGVFALIAVTVANFGFASLWPLAKLVLLVHFAILFFALVVLGIVARICGLSIWILIRILKDELILAYSTASSESVLPRIIEKMEAYGAPASITSFVVPTGYSFNLDGSTLYQSIAAIFIAQLYGIDLSLWQEIVLVLTLMVTSKGIAGVPGVSFVVLLATLGSVGIPLEGLAFIAGVDRILDMARTALNVVGNALAVLVIAKWEHKFDRKKALAYEREVLGKFDKTAQ